MTKDTDTEMMKMKKLSKHMIYVIHEDNKENDKKINDLIRQTANEGTNKTDDKWNDEHMVDDYMELGIRITERKLGRRKEIKEESLESWIPKAEWETR